LPSCSTQAAISRRLCGRVNDADNLLPALSAPLMRKLNRRINFAASDFPIRLRNDSDVRDEKVRPLRGLAFGLSPQLSGEMPKHLTTTTMEHGQ
jgi:hypothetical protein